MPLSRCYTTNLELTIKKADVPPCCSRRRHPRQLVSNWHLRLIRNMVIGCHSCMVIRQPCFASAEQRSNPPVSQNSSFLWVEVMCANCVRAKLHGSVKVLENCGLLFNDVPWSEESLCSKKEGGKKNLCSFAATGLTRSAKYARFLMTSPHSGLQFTGLWSALRACSNALAFIT